MNVGALLSQRAFSQSPAAPRSRVGRTNPDRALSLKPNKSTYSPVSWSVMFQVMAVQDGYLLRSDTLPLDALPQTTPGTAAQAATADLRLTFHPTPSQPRAMTGWAGSIRKRATLSHHGTHLTEHKQTLIVDATLTRSGMPKFLELFAGAGGMTMGFEAAGWECVGHAEIEPHARAVLRHQWPEVPLYGDVCNLDGTTLPPFDLLTFGAPCQDLSIAGKRAGMTEGSGTRSSLFFEAIRIWQESTAPLALYENVLGAYSSNNGKDFAAVLSAFVGAAVPVPADGWRGAGVASGPAGIAAWRTLDLQHFGWDGNTTPQRRRRVFVLGTRTGAVDPAEVLLVADGLLGHLATSGEAREGTAEDAPAGPAISFQNTGQGWWSESAVAQGIRASGGDLGGGSESLIVRNARNDVAPTLDSGEWRGPNRNQGGVLAVGDKAMAWQHGDHQNRVTDYTALVLRSRVQGVDKQQGIGFSDTSPTLKTDLAHQMGPVVSVSEATAFNWQSGGDVRLEPRTEQANTLQANTLQANQTQAVVLRNREGKPGGGKGPLVSEERSLTLGTSNDQVVFTQAETFRMVAFGEYDTDGTALVIKARGFKDATDLAVGSVGIPRRLMPIECERLMGWPDHHTAMGTDEQGRDYALSDTARYKLCGNGVGSPVTAWIGMRLKLALDNQ